MEKSCRNYALKSSPWPLLNFVKQLKTTIACKKLICKWDILKEDYQKASKKLTLFFLSNPISFNKQDHEIGKCPENSDQSLIRL